MGSGQSPFLNGVRALLQGAICCAVILVVVEVTVLAYRLQLLAFAGAYACP